MALLKSAVENVQQVKQILLQHVVIGVVTMTILASGCSALIPRMAMTFFPSYL
jgi:hypothetical protein